MSDIAILVWLQASGKSTFNRRHLAGTHVLVSKDLLRNNRRPARRHGAGRGASSLSSHDLSGKRFGEAAPVTGASSRCVGCWT